MKKWMFLFFLLFLLFYPIKKEQAEEVFAIDNKKGNQFWCLDVSKSSFTSKNLGKFLNVTILEVYPKNKILGLDDTTRRQLEKFSYHSIVKLEETYRRKLQKLGFFEESEKVERVGILLEKIKVFGKKEEIDKLDIANFLLNDIKKCDSINEYD